jgi:hypothetical protein
MSEFEKQKYNVMEQLKSLCAHCSNDIEHNCRIQRLVDEVATISGIPLIVNDRFKGLLMPGRLAPQRVLAGMN